MSMEIPTNQEKSVALLPHVKVTHAPAQHMLKAKPQIIHWHISSQCQLQCFFCYAIQEKPSLRIRQCTKIIDNIVNSGSVAVIFSGGEPFYDQKEAAKVVKIVNLCKQRGLYTALDTNAIELVRDKKLLGELDDILDRIGLPLDGSSSGTHDILRGRVGHFDEIIETLNYLESSRIKIKINTVITRANTSEICKIGNLLEGRQVSLWSLYQFCPIGKGAAYQDLYNIEEREFNKIVGDILVKYPRIKVEPVTYSMRKGTYFAITSSGDVYTTPSNGRGKHIRLGNALETNIAQLWDAPDVNKKGIKKRYQIQLQLLHHNS